MGANAGRHAKLSLQLSREQIRYDRRGRRANGQAGQETVTWKEAVAVMGRIPTLVRELMVKTPVMVAEPADTPVI